MPAVRKISRTISQEIPTRNTFRNNRLGGDTFKTLKPHTDFKLITVPTPNTNIKQSFKGIP